MLDAVLDAEYFKVMAEGGHSWLAQGARIGHGIRLGAVWASTHSIGLHLSSPAPTAHPCPVSQVL